MFVTDYKSSLKITLISVLVAIMTILACVLPMSKLPLWNGEQPGHRNQYELMADALLDGRISFDYNDDQALSELENPYDPNERKTAGVKYHWDHAYYNGNYYMYFGIVPVLLVFLPYRVITGAALTTYHATQIFSAVAIAGIFALFYMLKRLFFPKLSHTSYLFLSVAASVMSLWYATAEPALYCTAITSAIALEVWSIYFFVRAVWGEKRENMQILYAAIGALLGALVFGCRPPIALANIIVIPMLVVFLKQRKFSAKLLVKLLLAALPYIVVGIALMVYNYARFDNPFEFGQSYQLTVADQSNYSVKLNKETLVKLFNETVNNLFATKSIAVDFPYLKTSSVLFNFPALLAGALIFKSSVYKTARAHKILSLIVVIYAAVLVINAFDILWTPYLLERYRMDIYFLLAIACYITVGLYHQTASKKMQKYLPAVTVVVCTAVIIGSFLLCVRTVGNYYPDKVTEIAELIKLS